MAQKQVPLLDNNWHDEEVTSTLQTHGTFPVGPGGGWKRRCEARVAPDNEKETRK